MTETFIILLEIGIFIIGAIALSRQRKSPPPLVKLPAWDISDGEFLFFAGAIFVVTQFIIPIPLFIFLSKPLFYSLGLLCIDIASIALIIWGAKEITGRAVIFNFPEVKKSVTDDSWKNLPCVFGAMAVTSGVMFVIYSVCWLLGIDLPAQEIATIFDKNRDNAVVCFFMFFALVIGAPVSEELFFRGCIYRFLKNHTTSFFAAIITGIIFGAIHFNLGAFLPLSAFGAYLCWIYERTGDIRTPIFAHAVSNFFSYLVLLIAPDF